MNARAEVDFPELRRISSAVLEARPLQTVLRSAEAQRDVWAERVRILDSLHPGDLPYVRGRGHEEWEGLSWERRLRMIKDLLAAGAGLPELADAEDEAYTALEDAEEAVDQAELNIVNFVVGDERHQKAILREYRSKAGGWRLAWLVSKHTGLGITEVMRFLPAMRRAGLIKPEPDPEVRERPQRKKIRTFGVSDPRHVPRLDRSELTLLAETGNCGGGHPMPRFRRS